MSRKVGCIYVVGHEICCILMLVGTGASLLEDSSVQSKMTLSVALKCLLQNYNMVN